MTSFSFFLQGIIWHERYWEKFECAELDQYWDKFECEELDQSPDDNDDVDVSRYILSQNPTSITHVIEVVYWSAADTTYVYNGGET